MRGANNSKNKSNSNLGEKSSKQELTKHLAAHVFAECRHHSAQLVDGRLSDDERSQKVTGAVGDGLHNAVYFRGVRAREVVLALGAVNRQWAEGKVKYERKS